MAAGMLAVTSCTDFDDYNEVVADATPSANQTLWQNILQNPQLSDFASLVKKSGFDANLDQTHYYTVWAPLNSTFDPSEFQNMDDNALMRQFVKNHIASYSHTASGDIGTQRILMLNEKSYSFEGSSTYKFDDVTLNEANLPSSNGLLHTLNGVATFYPNLYEFITDSLLSGEKGIDSLRNFYRKYETTELDKEASVVGPIVNGMQTYVDSVMVTENSLWYTLNALVQHEDSSYTFIMPTNKGWESTFERVKGYYNYLPTTNAQNLAASPIATVPITIDNAYWQDSLASSFLTRYLIYSNNNSYNQWLKGTPSAYGSDTLQTTLRKKLSNPDELLGIAKEQLKMSNGMAYVVDSLALNSWETFSPVLVYTTANSDNIGRVVSGSSQTITVKKPRKEMIDMSYRKRCYNQWGIDEKSYDPSLQYMWVEPTSASGKPELDIYLPNVRSTTYDFYCVFVPAGIEEDDADETLPNRVVFTLNYCDAKGTLQNYVFKDNSAEHRQWFDAYYQQWKDIILADNPKQTFSNPDANTLTAFSNDVSKVDTVYLGEFTFPVSYYGLSTTDKICPNIKITTPYSTFNRALLGGFARDLRIASIILKPKEFVEFEESNK